MQRLSDLRQYVTDLASIPRLSHEEARHLTSRLAAVRQGTLSPEQAAQAKQRLIEGHLWLAVSLVKRSGARLCTLSPLDLVQQGNLGLLRALDRFDCAFSDLLAAPPLVLADPAAAEEERRQAKRAQVEALLARLTPREQQILRLRYGLGEVDGRTHTPTAIARKLGLDCSTVCNLERRALQKLRSQKHPEGEEDQHPQVRRSRATPHDAQAQEQRRNAQHQRLEAARALLAARGQAINVRSLARLTHVDKAVIGPFLHRYWERQGTEQERLEAACAALEAEGLPVTMARLCSRAHVGSQAAAACLKNYHPVVRPKQRPAAKARPTHPAKAPPKERLSEAYTRLVAQGEQVTRARLPQEAGVSTDAARMFLGEKQARTRREEAK